MNSGGIAKATRQNTSSHHHDHRPAVLLIKYINQSAGFNRLIEPN